MAKLDAAALHRRWVHSHEEDTADAQVFRPSTFTFPPSRGRDSFELKPDGALVERGPGPTDRSVQSSGWWQIEGDDQLAFRRDRKSRPHRVLHIVSATPDRLVIKR